MPRALPGLRHARLGLGLASAHAAARTGIGTTPTLPTPRQADVLATNTCACMIMVVFVFILWFVVCGCGAIYGYMRIYVGFSLFIINCMPMLNNVAIYCMLCVLCAHNTQFVRVCVRLCGWRVSPCGVL